LQYTLLDSKSVGPAILGARIRVKIEDEFLKMSSFMKSGLPTTTSSSKLGMFKNSDKMSLRVVSKPIDLVAPVLLSVAVSEKDSP